LLLLSSLLNAAEDDDEKNVSLIISRFSITIMWIGMSIEYLMQIPRGTFRALKKGCDLHTLIQELRDSAFSGYCRMSPGSGSITLVFDKGTIQLAQYDALEGDAALERICNSGPVTVNAVLHDLSPVQLAMAMEFSPLSVVKTEMERIRVSPQGDRDRVTSPILRKSGPEKETADQRSRPDRAAPHTTPVEKHVARRKVPQIQATDDDISLLSRELDALDSMDIESMAAKFRANYRLLMERLELDHLIDQKTGKDAP
jgi:hypothetical protein